MDNAAMTTVRLSLVYLSPTVLALALTSQVLAAGRPDHARPDTPAGACLTLLDPKNSVDFGQRSLGAAGVPRALTLGNSGLGALNISSIALAGPDMSAFSVLEDGCASVTLATGETCSLLVDFVPVSLGNKSARLRVTDSAAGSPHEVPLSGTGFDPAVPSRQAGPIDLRHGFPIWYQDDAGLRVTLCYDDSGLCTNPLPNPALEPAVGDALINFPEEAFWSYAEARMILRTRAGGGGARTRLTLSKEAAFLPGPPAVAQQVAFDRIRVRIENLTPGAMYTVTHPFGVLHLTASSNGKIDYTSDVGCGGPPCDFSLVLGGPLAVHLRWDPALPPFAPAGYLGDPAVPHTIVGSPLGTNFFRVTGPNAGGPGIDTIQTHLFTVEGKLF